MKIKPTERWAVKVAKEELNIDNSKRMTFPVEYVQSSVAPSFKAALAKARNLLKDSSLKLSHHNLYKGEYMGMTEKGNTLYTVLVKKG